MHPACVRPGFEKLRENIRVNEIVVGDLNADFLQASGRNKIDAFCTQLNLIPSHHGPTRGAAQLDHVLIPEQYTNYENLRYMHTLTFANLYSDHRAVAIRLSNNEID